MAPLETPEQKNYHVTWHRDSWGGTESLKKTKALKFWRAWTLWLSCYLLWGAYCR